MGKKTWVLRFLQEKYYSEPASQIIICLPKNSSEMLDEAIEDYRKAAPSCLINDGLPNVAKMGLLDNNDHKIIGKL